MKIILTLLKSLSQLLNCVFTLVCVCGLFLFALHLPALLVLLVLRECNSTTFSTFTLILHCYSSGCVNSVSPGFIMRVTGAKMKHLLWLFIPPFHTFPLNFPAGDSFSSSSGTPHICCRNEFTLLPGLLGLANNTAVLFIMGFLFDFFICCLTPKD